MKLKELKDFEFEECCSGSFMYVNGIDYNDLSEADVIEFITDVLKNDCNKSHIIQEVFKTVLENIQYDREEFKDNGICEDCGSHCNRIKYYMD